MIYLTFSKITKQRFLLNFGRVEMEPNAVSLIFCRPIQYSNYCSILKYLRFYIY